MSRVLPPNHHSYHRSLNSYLQKINMDNYYIHVLQWVEWCPYHWKETLPATCKRDLIWEKVFADGIWLRILRRDHLGHPAATKLLQSCPTLCDPIDGNPPDSPIPGILQARTLEWVAISFSNASKWKVKVKLLSRVRPSATPWTAAYQVPPSMGFSRQEYWSGAPLPSPQVQQRSA